MILTIYKEYLAILSVPWVPEHIRIRGLVCMTVSHVEVIGGILVVSSAQATRSVGIKIRWKSDYCHL